MATKKSNIGKPSPEVKAKLKEFHAKIALLKRKNIAYKSKRTKDVKQTRHAKELLRKIEATGFFDKQAHIQKITKQEERILKERGYVAQNRRVILKSSAEHGERLVKLPGEKHRAIQYISPEGTGYKDLIPVQSWEEYLEYMRSKWASFHANGYELAFRFYGHLSRRTFGDIDQALRELSKYVVSGNEVNSLNPSDMQDVIQHIEIYKTKFTTWDKQDAVRQRKRKSKPRPYKVRMAKILQTQGRTVYQAKVSSESKKRAVRRSKKKGK